MQDRETKVIVTPSGKEVVIKAYLTGREKREIENAAMPTSIDYNQEDGVKGLNPQAIMSAKEDAMLRNVIISVDGQTGQDFADVVLNMRSSDSDFVIAATKAVVEGLSEEKKTT